MKVCGEYQKGNELGLRFNKLLKRRRPNWIDKNDLTHMLADYLDKIFDNDPMVRYFGSYILNPLIYNELNGT